MLQQTEPESNTTASVTTNGGTPVSAAVSVAGGGTEGTASVVGSQLGPGAPAGVAQLQATAAAGDLSKNQPKRLHVSNIPFRFRDPDLRAMFGVSKGFKH